MNGRSRFELFCVDVRPDEQGNYRVHRYGCPQFPDEYEFLGTFLSGRQAVQISQGQGIRGGQRLHPLQSGRPRELTPATVPPALRTAAG